MITALDIAKRFTGIKEVSGPVANPQILAMLKLDNAWPTDDSVPWCAAFVNYVCWLLDLPRSKSLRARSWLKIGQPIEMDGATPGFDIVVFKRGGGNQPGPDVIEAPGHVAFYVERTDDRVMVLGGNQSDTVNVSSYPVSRVLGVRRLA